MTDREKAKELYTSGGKLKTISDELNINYSTIKQWKKRDNWGNVTVTKKCNQSKKGDAVKKRVQKKVTKLLPISESKELSPQERLFCEIYDKGHNATQAYIKAYKVPYNIASSHAYEVVGKRGVKAYLEKLRQQRREAFNLEPFDIVERMMLIAFSDMGNYVQFGNEQTEDGKTDYVSIVDSSQVDTSLISEVSQSRDGVKVKLNDQFKALEWCANYFEMNPNDNHRKEYDEKRLQIEHEKLDIVKEKAKSGMDGNDVQKINEGIESLAELINNPVSNRKIEDEK